MSNDTIAKLEHMLGGPRDGALLRFSLGNEWLKGGRPETAALHLRAAVEKDPRYSAAWKLLGKALLASGDAGEAIAAWQAGIAAAEARGDVQAAKEMRVFLKRAEKSLAARPDVPEGGSEGAPAGDAP